MFKLIKKNFRQLYSLLTVFLMLLQNVIPVALAVQPIYAAEQTVVSNISLEFDNDNHELIISGETNQDTDYLLTYDDNDDSSAEEAVTGQVSATSFEERVFVGTCSGEDCVEDEVNKGQLEFPQTDYKADYQISDDVLWLTRDQISTVKEVELNKTYLAPQNDQVSVTFTKLPEEAGSLSIEEVILSDQQVEQLGALSNVAYDITSSMEDGTFEYDLTLPLPEGADDTAKVVYADNVDELANVKELNKTVNGNEIKAEKVDHFTVFIITDDDATYSSPWIDYATQGYLNTGVHYPITITSGETATWDFSTADPGTYKVFVSWSTHSNRTISAPYSLTHAGGTEDRFINQELLADQVTTGGSGEWSNWYYYGEYTIDGSSKLVLTGVDNSSGSEYVIADEVLLANSSVSPTELWVDDDYSENLNNDSHIWQYDAFDSIQDAVDAAADSSTVHVKSGTYQEQVIINKDIELLGENNPNIISIDSPDSFNIPESSKTFEPIVLAFGGNEISGDISGTDQINVIIDGFDIDGNDRTTSGGKRPTAVFFRNVIGSISNNIIHNMHIGSYETFGIFVYGNSDLNVLGNDVSGYARGGIGISGDNGPEIDPVATVKDNSVSGPGLDEELVWAPNGIQVGYGATGLVEKNIVTGNGWPGSSWSSTAILVVDTSNVIVKENTVENNEQAIGVVDFPESVYGPAWSGIVSNIDVINNNIDSNKWGISVANEVDNINLIGNKILNIEGDAIDVYTYADTVTPPTNVVIKGNSIESIGADGLWIGDSVTQQVNAEKNWWGDATGPSGDATGLGVSLIGNASYCPWINNGDINDPEYAGSCLGFIQGRTFIDLADNGLLLSDDGDHPDGMQDGFTVRLYGDAWNFLGEQTTNTTGKVGQYQFEELIDENDTYRVCGVQKDGYIESVPELGQHVVDTIGGTIPSKYSDALIINNESTASDEFSRCWETVLENNDGAYLGIGYISDTQYPEMSDITMFVNGEETSLSKPGDEVKVQATVEDVSGVDKVQIWVREYPWSPNNNQLIAGEMTHVSGDLWEYVFTVPEKYQDSDDLNQDIDGNYFNFRPYDSVGNSHIGWRQNFTIDDTNPTGQIITPADGEVLGSSVDKIIVSGTVDDYSTGIKEVKVRLRNHPGNTFRTDWVNAPVDGSGNYSVEIDISTMPEDTYEVAVVAYDQVGNNKWLWRRPVIEIDRTAPAAPTWGTIYRGHGVDLSNEISCGGYTNDPQVTFEWDENSEDDIKGYWFGTKFKEKHQWFDMGSTVKTANMTPGNNPYHYTVIAVDNAGNESEISEQCGLTLDQEDPSSIITTFDLENGGEESTNEFLGLIEGTATDATSGVDHVLLSISHLGFGEEESARQYWDATGSGWLSTQSLFRAIGTDNWEYQLPEEGIIEGFYNITSHAVDKAGNVENTYTIKIVYDKTIPEVELSIDPASPDGDRGWYRFINPTIILAASDNYDLDYIEYQWNSTTGSWTKYVDPFNVPSEGQNILYYRAIDKVKNVSDPNLGVKEVKYDATDPAGAPINVKVSNITSDTADAEWEAPDPDDDVAFYRLSWKHEDGTVHGAETGFDDFDHQLDQLYNGEWTLYVKAMDEAGNFTESSTKFRVGPGPSSDNGDQGNVLGATTDGTGVGGAYLAQTTTTGSEEKGESTGSSEAGDSVVTTDEGEVLGTDTCAGLINYLPLLILLAVVIATILFELLYVGTPLTKVGALVAMIAVSSFIYFYFRDDQCRPDQGLMKMIDSWFVIFSIAVALISKVMTQVLFKGE